MAYQYPIQENMLPSSLVPMITDGYQAERQGSMKVYAHVLKKRLFTLQITSLIDE
jgi:hypothetical protein